ncbi:MAG: hypothetical protein D6B27_07910 [Gammaproteobacteria bacterium]|nr:MAG: hypothetical protein D6B27_07910 [Gammaproteobacteria bacterium]
MLYLLNRGVITIILLFQVIIASAYELEDVQIHGFIGQGYVYTSGDGERDDDFLGGSTDLFEAGINYSFSSKNWFSTGQLVSRDIGEVPVNEEKLALDFLVLGGRLITSSSLDMQVRLGKIKTPFDNLDMLDIPTARDYIVEGLSRINFDLRSVGAVLDLLWYSGFGSFDVNVGYLRQQVDGKRALKLSDTVDYISHRAGFNPLLRVRWNSPGEMFNIAYSRRVYDFDYSLSEDNPEGLVKLTLNVPHDIYQSLSFAVFWGGSKLQFKRSHIDYNQYYEIRAMQNDFLFFAGNDKGSFDGYNLSYRYDFSQGFSINAALDYGKYKGESGLAMPMLGCYTKIVLAGIDYYIGSGWTLRSNFSHSKSNVNEIIDPQLGSSVNMFAAEIIYSF